MEVNELFLNTEVSFFDEWKENLLDETYITKLKVDNKVYKYRLYYKTVWSHNENSKRLLSFVMLNPSYANQYSNDPTINNCIKIAKQNDYDGIEIVNIYSMRHPNFEKIKSYIKEGKGNPAEIDYDKAKLNNVVLAWGNKKIKNSCNNKLFNKLKNAKNIYILCVDNEQKIKKDYNYLKMQIRHPSNQAWTKLGGINNAKLLEIDKVEFNDNFVIQEKI